jgi:hypothetical protein
MTTHFSRRRLGLTLSLAAPMALAAATSVSAATISRFSWDVTYPAPDGVPSECLIDGLTATQGPISDHGTGIMVENAGGVTVVVRDGIDYAFDLSDGRHVEGFARGHSTYVEHGGVVVITDIVREPRTFYATDGTVVGGVMIHAVSHVVYDRATGIVKAAVDDFSFTCF